MASVRSDAVYSGLVSRCVNGADDILPTAFNKLVHIFPLVWRKYLAHVYSDCRSTGHDFCSHITSKCWILISSLTNIAAGLISMFFCLVPIAPLD